MFVFLYCFRLLFCTGSFVILFCSSFFVTLRLLMILILFVTTTTSRAVTVSTRGCTYRLPGSFRQFPLRGSNYADPRTYKCYARARQPCRRLRYNGSDGRSLLSSRPDVACVPLVTPAKSMQVFLVTSGETRCSSPMLSLWI